MKQIRLSLSAVCQVCETTEKTTEKPKVKTIKQNCRKIVKEFDKLPRIEKKIPKVAIVGDILVKYHPMANNH